MPYYALPLAGLGVFVIGIRKYDARLVHLGSVLTSWSAQCIGCFGKRSCHGPENTTYYPFKSTCRTELRSQW